MFVHSPHHVVVVRHQPAHRHLPTSAAQADPAAQMRVSRSAAGRSRRRSFEALLRIRIQLCRRFFLPPQPTVTYPTTSAHWNLHRILTTRRTGRPQRRSFLASARWHGVRRPLPTDVRFWRWFKHIRLLLSPSLPLSPPRTLPRYHRIASPSLFPSLCHCGTRSSGSPTRPARCCPFFGLARPLSPSSSRRCSAL